MKGERVRTGDLSSLRWIVDKHADAATPAPTPAPAEDSNRTEGNA